MSSSIKEGIYTVYDGPKASRTLDGIAVVSGGTPLALFQYCEEAAAYCSYLNGGREVDMSNFRGWHCLIKTKKR